MIWLLSLALNLLSFGKGTLTARWTCEYGGRELRGCLNPTVEGDDAHVRVVATCARRSGQSLVGVPGDG